MTNFDKTIKLNKMKKIIYGLLLCSGVLMAQEKNEDHHWGEQKLDELATELSLDDTQKDQLKSLHKKYGTAHKELREKHQEERCTIQQNKVSAMKQFLSKDQMQIIRDKRTASPMMHFKQKNPKKFEKALQARKEFNSELSTSERKAIEKARRKIKQIRHAAYPCKPEELSMADATKALRPIIEDHSDELMKIKESLHAKASMKMKHKHGSKSMKHSFRKHHGKEHHPGHTKEKMLYFFLLMDN